MTKPHRKLQQYRRRLERIDRRIVYWLERRFHVLEAITDTKLAANQPIYQPGREVTYRTRLREQVAPPYQGWVEAVFSTIMETARALEEQVLIQRRSKQRRPEPVSFPFERVVVIGLGLIGGSIVRALRAQVPRLWLGGMDRDPMAVSHARAYLDATALRTPSWVTEADLIILALPVRAIVVWLRRHGNRIRRAVVMDVGSVKRAICETGWQTVRPPAVFVGGHPMAGRERTGFLASQPDLFQHRPFFLCVPEGTDDAVTQRVAAVVETLGARPVFVRPEDHDRLVTHTSHVPQLIATMLAAWLEEQATRLHMDLTLGAGPGLYSMTRLAGSPYPLWQDILALNPLAEETLNAWLNWVRQQGPPYPWQTLFERARAVYQGLHGGVGRGKK